MSGLDLRQAPAPAQPLRWLFTAPLWGVAAGCWLLLHGEAAMAGRWSPLTVALVHLFTLGVLGNAMLGSLLQFLPVAAGSALPPGRWPAWLHAGFNLGLVLFVLALHSGEHVLMALAALLLGLPLSAFALVALPGLLARGGKRVLRAGIGMALGSLLLATLAGVALLLVLRGDLWLPLDRFTDAHALLGLLGWVLVLIASVGSMTVPMFQGTAPISERQLAAWLWLTLVALALAVIARLWLDAAGLAVMLAAWPALLWVGGFLHLSSRPLYQRGRPLVWAWRGAAVALGSGCTVAALAGAGIALPRPDMLAGTLVIGAGLPLIVSAMMLEIVAFLTWIQLRADCPRGIRIPGVGSLQPDTAKRLVLATQGAAGLLLVTAALLPPLARAAGLLLVVAHVVLWGRLRECRRQAAAFLQAHGVPR